MEQIQQPGIPHLLQLYQPSASGTIHISHPTLPPSQGKLTYQQSTTSESLPIQVSSHHVTEIQTQIQISQNQIMMSCQQGLQSLQPLHTQSQVLQSSDMMQSLQIASHVLLPQQMLLIEEYKFPKELNSMNTKEQSLMDKLEPEVRLVEKDSECQITQATAVRKKPRNLTPNPKTWACNIRRLKHQRGEAYVNKRGKYVPEKQIKNMKDCLKDCILKCSEKITELDRENIFKAFYSLNVTEKKFFLLSTTERVHIKRSSSDNPRRRFNYKFFFKVNSVTHVVCKKFYLGTLVISQKSVYNVHTYKTDLDIPKPDGRGQHNASTHSIPVELKDRVRKHINSFTTIDSEPVIQFSEKKQFLDGCLCVMKMYKMYFDECSKDNVVPVKQSMYRKILKSEYNLCFQRSKPNSQLCRKCKGPVEEK